MTLIVDVQKIPLKSDSDDVLRVGGTRVTLETVIHAFEQGHTAEEIVSHYPALRLADVYATIAYYLDHQDEIETYLHGQREAIEEIWEKIETNSDYQDFRRRLIKQRQARPGNARS